MNVGEIEMSMLQQVDDDKREWIVLLLSALTYLLWLYNLHPLLVVSIYTVVFIIFFVLKRPIIEFVIVVLLSVMSYRVDSLHKVDYYMTTILFGGVMIARIRAKKFTFGRLFLVLLIYLLYAMLSLSWSPDPRFGMFGIAQTVQGYMMYLVLTNSDWKLKEEDPVYLSKAATMIMLTLTAQLLTIYLKYPFEEILYKKSLVDLGWGYSNFIAVIYTFSLPVALYKYLDEKHYHPIYFLLDLLSFGGLLLTQSRGAIVGAIAGLGLYALLTFRKTYIKRYYSLIIGAGIVAYLFFSPYILEIVNRFIGPNFLDDSNRFPIYKLGIEKFLEAPIFGHGYKSSRYFIQNVLNGTVSNYHNYILQIAATLGVVGLIFQGWLHYLWVKLFAQKNAFILCMGIGIVASLVHQLLDVSYDRFYFGVYMYTIIGIVEIYRHNRSNDPWQMTEFSL